LVQDSQTPPQGLVLESDALNNCEHGSCNE
jgi:hypothetical protein